MTSTVTTHSMAELPRKLGGCVRAARANRQINHRPRRPFGSGRCQSLSIRKRRAFAITETELSDIASAPMIGLRRMPKVG